MLRDSLWDQYRVSAGFLEGGPSCGHGNRFSAKPEEFLTTEDGPIHLWRIGLGVARREERSGATSPPELQAGKFGSGTLGGIRSLKLRVLRG